MDIFNQFKFRVIDTGITDNLFILDAKYSMDSMSGVIDGGRDLGDKSNDK